MAQRLEQRWESLLAWLSVTREQGGLEPSQSPSSQPCRGSFCKASKRLQLHRRGSCSKRLRSLESLQSEQGREPHVLFFLLLKLLGRACVGVWPGTARRLQPEQGGGEGLLRGGQLLLPLKPCLAPGWARVQGQARARPAACVWKLLPSTCTGAGEGETKVPNELVKHLYNFSSFYKEGLLYTIYTWR